MVEPPWNEDYRVGGLWSVALPSMCFNCVATQLGHTSFDELAAFANPTLKFTDKIAMQKKQ